MLRVRLVSNGGGGVGAALISIHAGESPQAAMQRVLGYVGAVLDCHGSGESEVQRAALRLFSSLSATASALSADGGAPLLSARDLDRVVGRLQQLSIL